jgi:hypothetical protein
MWGISVFPEAQKAATAWGARAIMDEGFSLLPDRQSWVGADEPRQALMNWLNTKGLQSLRWTLRAEQLTQDSRTVITIQNDRYTLKATPNASYGYLYIAAWERELTGEGAAPLTGAAPLAVEDPNKGEK